MGIPGHVYIELNTKPLLQDWKVLRIIKMESSDSIPEASSSSK